MIEAGAGWAAAWGAGERVEGEIRAKFASGVAAQPARKRLTLGALRLWHARGLRNSARLGKLDLPDEISRPRRYADPPLPGGFCV